MYKITRVEEISRKSIENLNFHINKYINAELQEDEFLLHIEYFKDNEIYSTYPTLAYLHIAKLIKE
ncbi:hypothetical protein [Gemella haemolysans]|uniref:hypothetical protein n=1 Tax=Gemella haemolysans TaxID=1379 RepID=UPI0029131279|nr:hypothetical protein [Gemella haemolysans]MDU3832330.1 hypothetical protein [Gemella haemolysans]